MITFEEYKKECLEVAKQRPSHIRKGQSIFNYIDAKYGVAREAQFKHHIDCFYLDENIEDFLVCTYNVLKDLM